MSRFRASMIYGGFTLIGTCIPLAFQYLTRDPEPLVLEKTTLEHGDLSTFDGGFGRIQMFSVQGERYRADFTLLIGNETNRQREDLKMLQKGSEHVFTAGERAYRLTVLDATPSTTEISDITVVIHRLYD